jgi:hypothetical protein
VLYGKICQWGELPPNKVPDEHILVYMFHVWALIGYILKRPTNVQDYMKVF